MLGRIFTVVLIVPVLVSCLDPGGFNDDVLGLIVFKAGLIDPEAKLASWSEDAESACNWNGVKCDPLSNRVSEVVLDGFSLSGHIGRSLLRLQFLRVLSLSKNNLTGTVNPALAQIQSLNVIDLSENSLSGPVPDEFFRQCGSLKVVSFANNNLSGIIPVSLTSCSTLERLNLSSNRLSGQLPSGFWSLSSLQSLDVSDNFLEGEVPTGVENLYGLRSIDLSKNSFVGQLPENIGNCVMLESIDLSENGLTGALPESMQKLGLCTSLNLRGNLFTGEFPGWVGDMRSLEVLDLSANNFSGRIPESISYLQFLKEVNFSNNQFMGGLPDSFENWVSLLVLDVSKNLLNGNLPSWIFRLGLKTVVLSGNRFNGSIGYEYDSMESKTPPPSYQTLQVLDLSMNSLSGEIPSSIGNFSSLQVLNVSGNSLSGGVPSSVGKLKVTRVLDLSHNGLNGSIPVEIGGAVSLQELRLESNFLSGLVPADITHCSSLSSLVVSQNNLSGQIPAEIAGLTGLQILDLSLNNFSGSLPKELTNLTHLITFNVSHNHLEGELPVGDFFNTIPFSAVTGNPSLCGSVFNHSCPAVHQKPIVLNPNSDDSAHTSLSPLGHKRIVLSISSLIAIGAAVLIVLGVITVTILNNFHVRSSVWGQSAAPVAFSGGDEFSHSNGTEANYGKLVMFSGDAGFASGAQALLNKDCELGQGGFGAVYQTELGDGRSVAIKKLNVSSLIKSQQDFEREVKTLGSVRHPNLVAIEGYYWTPSLQLVINEYATGGSLHRLLHNENREETCSLSWQQRFDIVLGTAKGLAHLHQMNIIHYNMKSTNVLLTSAGDPKVGDYGLARLLPALDRYILSSKIQSALGYMAPEFACQTVKITEKCDVYGFGILVLEVVTGKRPVQYMEDDVVVLCDMVRRGLEDGNIEECIDKRLQGKFPVEEAIPVVKLGLICASHVPSNRPDMEEVIRILELIRSPPSESQKDLE
ncbi:PREDICTED: probable LRR receptor-like serine/threonine-protein kinase IRK [Ipomoea nil]|uniref:probable LRR receptor-like serine/threonine-protein kinase IRK n=1 Tax=Ipomoea nil TaxID=35883 RepID=UPI000901B00B|nr:PREDICTED: probable LRR receptor-like serine/threonine-protein kinase IRK [Ipomoea nil]